MMDFTLWDLRHEFTVQEAAYLWVEVDENNQSEVPHNLLSKANIMYGVLEEARRKGKIEQTTPTGPHAWMAQPFTPMLSRRGLKDYAASEGLKPLFLFPEERGNAGAETSGPRPEEKDLSPENEPAFKHSEDFRSVALNGENFTLTPQQARVVEILQRARERGTPAIGKYFILEEIESTSNRLRDIFKSSPKAWKALIVSGDKKGTYRLNI